MGFQQRLEIAKSFEEECVRYLESHGLPVVKNGTEHTHPGFVDQLRNNDTLQSKLIRFAPDGVMLIETSKVIHWEAKCGMNMEKDAYETYMRYFDMGCVIVVFVKNTTDGFVYWQYVEKIGFIPSDVIIAPFRPQMRHPIDEDDWICPRLGHGYAGKGSGTPYKAIDFGSLRKIENWIS